MIFVTHHQSAEVEQPGEESTRFCNAAHSGAAVDRLASGRLPVGFVGCNHFRAVLLHQLFVRADRCRRLCPQSNAPGTSAYNAFFQCGGDQFHFSRRSAFLSAGREEEPWPSAMLPMILVPLPRLVFPTCRPLFLAGTNVPSTKHSFKSNPPASLRCWASVSSRCSMTPRSTQFWKRRCAVWYGPYRGGKSCRMALRFAKSIILRSTLCGDHSMGDHAHRPMPGSSGRMGSTIFHCSSVKSIR